MALRKGPNTSLHCILRHCGVPNSTPRSSGLVRLVFGPFRLAIFLIVSETIENKNP